MISRTDVLQNTEHHLFFFVAIRIRHVDYVQDQVRFYNLFERRSKC